MTSQVTDVRWTFRWTWRAQRPKILSSLFCVDMHLDHDVKVQSWNLLRTANSKRSVANKVAKQNYSTLSTLFETCFCKFLELWDQSSNFWFRLSIRFLERKLLFLTEFRHSHLVEICIVQYLGLLVELRGLKFLASWASLSACVSLLRFGAGL